MDYLRNVYSTRYFWYHLARSELRTKYRRSKLGMLWALLYPFALTLLLSLVMGSIFKSSTAHYIPFVFSGVITWDWLLSSIQAGCNAFVNNEIYIKQCKHPLIIYPLKHIIACSINFSIAFIGLFIMILISHPTHALFLPIVVLLALPLMFLFIWPLAIISAFIGVVFRDFQQLILIMMQALWYVSPVFIQPQVFYSANLNFFVDQNPIYHFLSLIRAPLLKGEMPSAANYCYVIATALVFWAIAALLIKTKEKKVIFFI